MAETWDNDFEICDCKKKGCGCAGGRMSFAGPYMHVLHSGRPKTIYEWGPGFSTGIALGFGCSVFAIEHHPKYVPTIPNNDTFKCTRVQLLDDAYVTPWEAADLYFVDGRRRAACVVRTLQRCAENELPAVLCLHDAQRARYQEALRKWPHVRFLSRGFAVASFCLDQIKDIPKGEHL